MESFEICLLRDVVSSLKKFIVNLVLYWDAKDFFYFDETKREQLISVVSCSFFHLHYVISQCEKLCIFDVRSWQDSYTRIMFSTAESTPSNVHSPL